MRLMLSGIYVYSNLIWQNLRLQGKLGTEFTKKMKKSAGTKRCEAYLAKVRGGGKKKAKTSAKKTKGKK